MNQKLQRTIELTVIFLRGRPKNGVTGTGKIKCRTVIRFAETKQGWFKTEGWRTNPWQKVNLLSTGRIPPLPETTGDEGRMRNIRAVVLSSPVATLSRSPKSLRPRWTVTRRKRNFTPTVHRQITLVTRLEGVILLIFYF